MAIQRSCPFERQVTTIKDIERAMREHPQKLSSMVEGNIRIRIFKDKLLCDNYFCKDIKNDGVAMSYCDRVKH